MKIQTRGQIESAIVRATGAALWAPGVRRATCYLTPDLTVKATAGSRFRKNGRGRTVVGRTVVLTVGRPNYEERAKVRTFQKAGEPFPVKRVQLAFWPEKGRRS